MNDPNSLNIEGTVSKDPIFRLTRKNDSVCTFSIAVNRFYKDKQKNNQKETSFFEVETWDDEAKKCKELAHVGRRCRIRGEIRQDRWKTTHGNEPRQKVVIVAEFVEFRPEKKLEEGERDEQN